MIMDIGITMTVDAERQNSKRWSIWPEGLPDDFLCQLFSGRGGEARRCTGLPVGHDQLSPTSTYLRGDGKSDLTSLCIIQRVLAGAERYVSPLEPSINIVADGKVGEYSWI